MSMLGCVGHFVAVWSSCVVKSRRSFVIGVTGSAGKTTTVAMIAAVVTQPVARSVVGRVGSTQHNMNCDRGFPQSILRFDGWTRCINLARLWIYETVPLGAMKLMAGAGYPKILVLEYGLGGAGHIVALRSEEP